MCFLSVISAFLQFLVAFCAKNEDFEIFLCCFYLILVLSLVFSLILPFCFLYFVGFALHVLCLLWFKVKFRRIAPIKKSYLNCKW